MPLHQIASLAHDTLEASLWLDPSDMNYFEIEVTDPNNSDYCEHIGLTFSRIVPITEYPTEDRPLAGMDLEDYDGVYSVSKFLIDWLERLGAHIGEDFKN